MNDIAKRATADRFLKALEKEKISKAVAGMYIGLAPAQVSYLFNEKYWGRLGDTGWNKVLAWANSGYSLVEYPRHHPEAALQDLEKIVDPVADKLWQQSVDNVNKANEALKKVIEKGELKIPEHISEGIPASDNDIPETEWQGEKKWITIDDIDRIHNLMEHGKGVKQISDELHIEQRIINALFVYQPPKKNIDKDPTDIVHDFIKSNGTMVITGFGRKYYFLPYWFLDDGGRQWDLFTLGKVPKELEEAIKVMFGGK